MRHGFAHSCGTQSTRWARQAAIANAASADLCHRKTDVADKETVHDGYEAIADDYLAARRQDSADVQLLAELVQRLPPDARVLEP